MKRGMGTWALAAAVAGLVFGAACGGGKSGGPATVGEPADAGAVPDGSGPAGGEDGSAPDGAPDAGPPPADGGTDWFGTPGPWPTAPQTRFGPAEGLDAPIVDVSTDEGQNIWAVSRSALYLLRPGETRFRKYTKADGLYPNLRDADRDTLPPITSVAGGAAGEVFIGYEGIFLETEEQKQHDPRRFRGKLDRALLQPDGTLQVTWYNIHNNDALGFDEAGNVRRFPDGSVDWNYTDWSYHEDRTVMRFLYDHLYHRGTLYVGYDHGVGRIDAGRPDTAYHGFDFADHVHPEVINASGIKRMGEWRALALDPSVRVENGSGQHSGVLWMGGRWTAGAMTWTESLWQWTNNARAPRHPFIYNFTSPPVFPVAEGDDVYIHGIAALSDGAVYFASGPGSGHGLALWKYRGGTTYIQPSAAGLPGTNIIDLQRLPDDTILVAYPGSLWRWNPKPEPAGVNLGQIPGVGSIQRVYVDQMVSPSTAYVATGSGIFLLRF